MMRVLLLMALLIPLPVSAFEVESQEPYPGMLPDNSSVINSWMNQMKQWEFEQQMKDPEFDINNALAEYLNGSNDPTVQEELLQLSSDKN